MKVSIITAVYNGGKTLDDCITSVIGQSYAHKEYIIVDGNSFDNTVGIIKKYQHQISQWISEPDEGIFDALNKGIEMSTGDLIGFLHSDDIYNDSQVIDNVVTCIKRYNVDSCYGDLLYVDKNNINKIIRYWKSSIYQRGKFRYGWMPPHPTFFVKRELYERYGFFNKNFKISADYELMIRLIERYGISNYYLPKVLVKMRVGGASNKNLGNIIRKSCEDYKALKLNSLNAGIITILLKYLTKISQFYQKKIN